MLPLFVSDVPLHCINQSAIEFHIPAKLIIAILNNERGKIGQAVLNKNGTYDLGPMQVNTSWLPELKKYGISRQDVQYNACINIQVGAWILAKSITEETNLLTGIGNYNSHTFTLNKSYYTRVKINFTKINLITEQEILC